MHATSMEQMQIFEEKYTREIQSDRPLKVLDIGSLDVNGIYKELFKSPKYEYKGLDLFPGKNVDIVAAGPYDYHPVEDNSVDIIISGQTMEHVEAIWLWVLELKRVLKPGGLMCLIAPNNYPTHRHPVDCWRILADGMKYLLGTHARMVVFEAKEVGIDTVGIAKNREKIPI